jgi:hypothetical protein
MNNILRWRSQEVKAILFSLKSDVGSIEKGRHK